MVEVIYFAAIGCLAGVLAGLLGIGGGLVIVPLLALVLAPLGFPEEEVMRVAVATSLATIILTSFSSAYAHHRRGAVEWDVVWRLSLGLVMGALTASYVVTVLPHGVLKIVFVGFLLLVAYQMLVGVRLRAFQALPQQPWLTGIGGGIGLVSGVVGIGGGTMIVPFLVACQTNIRQAVATSSACGFFIALAAVLGFIAVSPTMALPDGSIGYIYLPAWIVISAVSVLCAPIGVFLAHHISTDKLKRVFAMALVIMASLLLFR